MQREKLRGLYVHFSTSTHMIDHRSLIEMDYAALAVHTVKRLALPLASLCAVSVLIGAAIFGPLRLQTLLSMVYVFAMIANLALLFIKKPMHAPWPYSPLRAARHATRIVWSGCMATLTSVLAAGLSAACYRTVLLEAMPVPDALVAWGAVLMGQAVAGTLILKSTRADRDLYLAALLHALLFFAMFSQ